MSMQSLKEIGQKVLKLEHGNKALTDRQMDGQTDGHSKFRGYNIIPHHFFVRRGIKIADPYCFSFPSYFPFWSYAPSYAPLKKSEQNLSARYLERGLKLGPLIGDDE